MRPFQFVLITTGLCLMAPLAYVVWQKALLWSRAETAVAIVLRNVVSSPPTRNRAPTLAPVVRFTTARGAVITTTSPGSKTTAVYKVGEQVKLRYDPRQPNRVELPDFASQWLPLLATSTFALFGWVLFQAGRRYKSQSYKARRQRR